MGFSSLIGTGFSLSCRCLAGVWLWGFAWIAMADPMFVLEADAGVDYRSSPANDWQPLSAHMYLDLPVEIQTRGGASVVLEQAGSTFTLKPDTRLSFSATASQGDGL